MQSSFSLEIPDSDDSATIIVSESDDSIYADKQIPKKLSFSTDDQADINSRHEVCQNFCFETTNAKLVNPPEQCSFISSNDTESDLHMFTDLFSHSAHNPNNLRQRYRIDQQKPRSCQTCYSAHCLNMHCWDPAKHERTVLLHPELKKKEKEDQRAVLAAHVKIYDPSTRPSMHPVEGWNYLEVSDMSDSDEEYRNFDPYSNLASRNIEESVNGRVNIKPEEDTSEDQFQSSSWLAEYIFPELASMRKKEEIDNGASRSYRNQAGL